MGRGRRAPYAEMATFGSEEARVRPPETAALAPQRIRGLGHWRAVRQMLRDYAPGLDSPMDMLRYMPVPLGPIARQIAAPLYFALEQGWMLRTQHGEMAALMYLRDQRRAGVGVIHVDDINVRAEDRGHGLARRLLALADDVARRRGYRYVKLEVEASNTPAVTLYRTLGYQEQHRLVYTSDAAALTARAATEANAAHVRSLTRSGARRLSRAIFRAEREADTPTIARVMVAYYAPRVPRRPLWLEAIAREGTDVGYWVAQRDRRGIAVELGLAPELWGGEVERALLRLLAERARPFAGSSLRLRLMSGGHHRALREGAAPLHEAFGLLEVSDTRMVMVKALAND